MTLRTRKLGCRGGLGLDAPVARRVLRRVAFRAALGVAGLGVAGAGGAGRGALGCGGAGRASGDESASALPQGVGLLVTENDGSVGALESIDSDTHARVTNTGSTFDGDPHLRRLLDPRTGRSRYFLVQSRLERLIEVDRAGHLLPNATFDVADPARPRGQTDPLDVALAPDGALWVTRHGSTSLLVLEPGGTPRCTVDLKAFADEDGSPEMSAVAVVSGVAYVALRRLRDHKDPTNVSSIVAIDTRGCGPAAPFVDLPVPNPWERFVVRGPAAAPELWVSCIGGPLSSPAIERAGLVRIDLAARKAELRVSAASLGGFAPSFEIADDRTGFAAVGAWEGDNPTSIVRFDPTTGARDPSFGPIRTASYKLWSLAVAKGAPEAALLVADRSEENPGIRVLSARDGARLGHIPTRLLPVELLVVRSDDP